MTAKERQRVLVDKKLVSADLAAENDRLLHIAAPGMMAEAVYYDKGEYLKRRGLIAAIEPQKRYIRIVDTTISFDDLFEIRLD